MTFPIPQFPITGDLWFAPRTTDDGGPDLTDIEVQLYSSPHNPFVANFVSGGGSVITMRPMVQIRKHDDGITMRVNDLWEVPSGSAQYYRTMYWLRCYVGFPQNQLLIYAFPADSIGDPLFEFNG